MNDTAVLISIKSKWAAKIFSGEKTVEDRKTTPDRNNKVPYRFLCYVYESGTGMVTGEFSCDWIEALTDFFTGEVLRPRTGSDCLTDSERNAYANGKFLYGWHIAEAVEYATPLSLFDFCDIDGNPIKKPPQSWRYVQKRVE